jgi:hypothetical protein
MCQTAGLMVRPKSIGFFSKVAAKIELNSADPGSTCIQVPAKDGEVKPKLFAHCSVEDLRKALAHLRTPTDNGGGALRRVRGLGVRPGLQQLPRGDQNVSLRHELSVDVLEHHQFMVIIGSSLAYQGQLTTSTVRLTGWALFPPLSVTL